MAFRLVTVYLVLMVALLMLVDDLHDSHGGSKMLCFRAEAASIDTRSRKFLDVPIPQGIFKSSYGGVNRESDVVGWSLRAVPSGPDPLHHNGKDPKKPRTSP